MTDELIETIARQPKILHYLDIPIQHCNDAILKAMRRRNTRVEIEALFAPLCTQVAPITTAESFDDLAQ